MLTERMRWWLLLLVGCGAGRFDRDRMDEVVAGVRPLLVVPNQVYRFRLADDLDAATLTPWPTSMRVGRGDGRGLVNAAIDEQTHIAVSIETRDEGHAGEWGFMFTDDGVSRGVLEMIERDSQHTERETGRWVRWRYDMD
jgi:hypothetical protein